MRYEEVDSLRGWAVIGMIIYHLLVDLELFYGMRIGVFEYPIVLLARVVAIMFIVLLGMAAYWQFENSRKMTGLIKKGMILLFWGGIISLITYILFPDNYVRFGILHFMGVSLVIVGPLTLVKSKIFLLIIGLMVMMAGWWIKIPTRATFDFYPMVPWFGLVIWGVVLGKVYLLWRKGREIAKPGGGIVRDIGRHSLAAYLVHQPILLTILFLGNKIL